MTPELRQQVTEYFNSKGVPEDRTDRVDVILALSHINTPEALSLVEELMGKPITHCPANLPPWPPKPVSGHGCSVRISKKQKNPFRETMGTFSRFQRIRVGMTRDDVAACGIPAQDVARWTRAGYLEWSTKS